MSDRDAESQNGSSDSSNDSLNGSWVKLDESFKNGNGRVFSVHNGEMEDLLAEAADDRASGTNSQRQSLSTMPTNDRTADDRTADDRPETERRVSPPENLASDPKWIENWASRIEPNPPKKWQLTYPPQKYTEKKKRMSITDRKTDAFQLNFYIVIPTLLVTHIIAFGIGFYIGRRSSSGSVAI